MRKLIFTCAILLAIYAVIAARNFDRNAQIGQSFSSPAASSLAAETARSANSLCNSNEMVVFNCQIAGRGKLVSLCSSRPLSKQQGYLQHRFGRPGAIELEYPRERQNTQTAFKYSRYTRPRVTLLTVSFETNSYTYEIHDDDNSEEPMRQRDFYLTVTPPGTNPNSTEMRCGAPVTSHLINLEDIVPNEEAP
ncbi:MAG TPA: hypothetical protein VK619_10995 [Pyrinomonadaceae bacterium]|nr:hypothetical protein [Pyrinomonadaceae bacterium]